MTKQELLDTLINSGAYRENGFLMCRALKQSTEGSAEMRAELEKEIGELIHPSRTLAGALIRKNTYLRSYLKEFYGPTRAQTIFNISTVIYSDWENRQELLRDAVPPGYQTTKSVDHG